jgi:hypothetical protein
MKITQPWYSRASAALSIDDGCVKSSTAISALGSASAIVTQRSKLRLAPQVLRALPNLKTGETFFFAI